MEIAKISLKEYLLFYKNVYKEDRNFKDNKSGLIKIVCGEGRPFLANSKQEVIAVKEGGNIFCACALVIHKNAPNMLSFAFFEALPNCQEAVDILIDYASKFGRKNCCGQMIVSLDGHINNGVSFPSSDSKPSFGESYCPLYYHSYFNNLNKVKFTSFYEAVNLVDTCIARDLLKLEKLKGNMTIEYADFASDFNNTMRRYTDLNNEIFANHKYYFRREYSEDYDLFYDMRPLLKNENLIFAKRDGKDIGFILWYPDYNELIGVGKGASILTFIKYKILKQMPTTAKVVEIGIAAKYSHFGTSLFLLNAAIEKISKNTKKIVSSWILDENIRSKAISQRYVKKHYKDYFAYEKEL